jgi:hypothetical protein
MKQHLFMRYLAGAALMLTLVTGCKKQIETENNSYNQSESALQSKTTGEDGSMLFRIDAAQHANGDLLKSLREATSRFNSTTQAIDAGYQPDDHCVAVPGLGGMGYHWANGSLIDPVVDLLKPEVVLYETGPGGNLRLVAVEFIVVNTGQARPMFGDHPFDIGGTPLPIPHWSLHVWIHKENPNGIFRPFNPMVSCP